MKDPNYLITTMVAGAILLAAIYHSMLFLHNRFRLIGYYSLYLWAAFIYCLLRCFYVTDVPEGKYLVPDELFQMLSFALYIRFTRVAMELDPVKDKLTYLYCRIAPIIIAVYLLIGGLLHGSAIENRRMAIPYLMAYFGIRVFLLLIGFTSLLVVLPKRRKIYFSYIILAILSIIFSGIISTITEIFFKDTATLNSLSILLIGYAIDVCFFSAAISYKMHTDRLEKDIATRRVLEQELLLQKADMDRVVSTYKARDEERSRIAMELHDEIGSTLSSISILSDVIHREQNETSKSSMQLEIRNNSKLVMERMDDIIFSLNPRNDSIDKMLFRIRQFATPLFEARNIDYSFLFDHGLDEANLSMVQRQQVYLILKEGVNNLIKHSNCSIASIEASLQSENLVFCIRDNGKGFDSGLEFEGNGMLSMKDRADKMQARLEINSVPFQETRLSLFIKIG